MRVFVEMMLSALTFHLAMGALFAIGFHWRGVKRIDPSVVGAGLGFRLLITPGVAALWPLLAVKWVRALRGRRVLGSPEAPVPPRRLGVLHRLAWRALAVVGPIIIGVAIACRPTVSVPTTIPVLGKSGVDGR